MKFNSIEERNEFIQSNMKLVPHCCKKYMWDKNNIDDYLQVGYLALIDAVDRYDESLQKTTFAHFACIYIEGYVKSFIKTNYTARSSESYKGLSYKDLVSLEDKPLGAEDATYLDGVEDVEASQQLELTELETIIESCCITHQQKQLYKLMKSGITVTAASKILGTTKQNVSQKLQSIKKRYQQAMNS